MLVSGKLKQEPRGVSESRIFGRVFVRIRAPTYSNVIPTLLYTFHYPFSSSKPRYCASVAISQKCASSKRLKKSETRSLGTANVCLLLTRSRDSSRTLILIWPPPSGSTVRVTAFGPVNAPKYVKR